MLKWTSELSVGVKRLDDQHQRWLEIVNDLEGALSGGADLIPRANRALVRMIDYTRVHFAAEEDMMLETGYSEYKAHKAAHKAFVKQLESITVSLQEGNTAAAQLLIAVARKWFVEHILVVDKRYVQHFDSHRFA